MKYRTSTTERGILKKLMIRLSTLLLVSIAVAVVFFMASSKVYIDRIPLSTLTYGDSVPSADSVTVDLAEAPQLRLEGMSVDGDTLLLNFSPVSSGDAWVVITAGEDDLCSYIISMHVTSFGLIIDNSTYRIPHSAFYAWMLFLMLTVSTTLIWQAFGKTQKVCVYSYLSLFFSGFAVWLTAITVMILYYCLQSRSAVSTLQFLADSGNWFSIISFPFCLVFSIGLSVSNLSLIRHEGKRRMNLLGFLLSFLLIAGGTSIIALRSLDLDGSAEFVRMIDIAVSVVSTLYVLLECFLIGAIICGVLSVKRKPAKDADYIIILGCAIRKDGTLFPLLRGRVDRALSFAREQEKQTGKRPVLVPSGGQGRDEVTSEAEAMQRYLLEQGVPQEQILPENKSVNTAENMRFSKKLIEERSPQAKVLFATTNYHVFRSGIISRQADFSPVGIGSDTKWYYWPNAAVRELIGMLSYLRRILVLLFLRLVFLFVLIHLFLPL